jgi:hypothetical protein
MDEMLNSCKEILCHQKLPHFVQSTNNLIGPFHIMVDPPKVEHFVVMAMCLEELMDQMLNTCKKSCAITTWLIELFGILAMGACNLLYGLDFQLLQEILCYYNLQNNL